MSPSSRGDSSSDTMLLRSVVDVLRATESAGQSFPMIGISSRLRLRDRSGLITVQVSPRSSLRYSLLLAQYSRLGEWGLMMYGASQFTRSPPAGGPPGRPGPPWRSAACCPAWAAAAPAGL